jgi:hypothetical protein
MSGIQQPQPGVASLVGGILEDAQTLVRQEVALAQREVAKAWDKAKTGVALLASALAACSVVGILLSFMFVKLLQQYLLPDHEWACFGVVGACVALFAGALVFCGIKQINQVHLSLPQSTESIRDDVQTFSEAVSGSQPTLPVLSKR